MSTQYTTTHLPLASVKEVIHTAALNDLSLVTFSRFKSQDDYVDWCLANGRDIDWLQDKWKVERKVEPFSGVQPEPVEAVFAMDPDGLSIELDFSLGFLTGGCLYGQSQYSGRYLADVFGLDIEAEDDEGFDAADRAQRAAERQAKGLTGLA